MHSGSAGAWPPVRHRRSRPGRAGRGVRHVTRLLAATVSAALLLGSGYGWYEYRSLDNGLHRVHLTGLVAARAPTRGPGIVTREQSTALHGVAQNILVTGIDSRAGLSTAERTMLHVGGPISLSTDTVMIIHVPADGARATMISIPRDSYVDIPGGFLKNKINAAYADGYTYAPEASNVAQRQADGMNLLIATVHQLTGLPINHYIQVGFGGFYTIARAIGGIRIDLCAATDDTYGYNEAHGEGRVGSGFDMSAGVHNLTPVQSLEFVRQRHNLTGGDLARERRQQYFLRAAFNKIASAGILLNPVRMDELIKAVTGAVTIDDTLSLPALATQMANLSASHIAGYTIPIDGPATENVAGQQLDVELVDPARVRAFVAHVISGRPGAASPGGASPGVTTTASAPTEAGASSDTTSATHPAGSGCIH